MKFNTAYSPGVSKPKECYNRESTIYKRDYLTKKINITKEPTYVKIQSYAESSTLSNVINRMAMGDSSALSSVSGQYLDISHSPHSLQEAHELGKHSQVLFNKLPQPIQERFGNNFGTFSKFVESVGLAELEKLIRPAAGNSAAAVNGGTTNE